MLDQAVAYWADQAGGVDNPDGFMVFGNNQTDRITTATKAQLQFTNDFELIVCWAPNGGWDAASNHILVSNGYAGPNTGRQFHLARNYWGSNGNSSYTLNWYETGGTARSAQSFNVSLKDVYTNAWGWVRVRFDRDNGSSQTAVNFAYSNDPIDTDPAAVTWTNIGTETQDIRTLNTPTGPLIVGGNNQVGTVGNHSFYVAHLYNGLTTGSPSLVAAPDARTGAQGWNAPPADDGVGNFWAFSGSAAWSPSTTYPGIWLDQIDKDLPGFTRFSGTGYLSTTNKAQLQLTGTIEMIQCLHAVSMSEGYTWTVQKMPSSELTGYGLILDSDGSFTGVMGDGTGRYFASTQDIPGGALGKDLWIRCVLTPDNGSSQRTASFYYSTQPPDTPVGSISWVQVGVTVTQSGAITLSTNTDVFEVCRAPWNGALMVGRVYYTEVRNGVGGTAVFNPDFRSDAMDDWSTAPRADSVGNTITFQGDTVWSGRLRWGHDAVSNGAVWDTDHWVLGGSGANLTVPHHAELDPGAGPFTFLVVAADDRSGSGSTVLATKQDTEGWQIVSWQSGGQAQTILNGADGVADAITELGSMVHGETQNWILKRDDTNLTAQIGLAVDEVDSSAVGTVANTDPIVFSDGLFEGRLYAAAFYDFALTDEQLAEAFTDLGFPLPDPPEPPAPTGLKRKYAVVHGRRSSRLMVYRRLDDPD